MCLIGGWPDLLLNAGGYNGLNDTRPCKEGMSVPVWVRTRHR